MIAFKVKPTDSNRITSPFGLRTHPITGEKIFHYGIDFGAVKSGVAGDNVYSVADGVVISSKLLGEWGNYVVIQHSGFVTLYAHLLKRTVLFGQTIKAGEVVGLMGSTGSSTAVHLHFGLVEGAWSARKWIDAKPYLTIKEAEVITKAKLKLNGVIKEADCIIIKNAQGNETGYFELKDLADAKIVVGWDDKNKIRFMEVK